MKTTKQRMDERFAGLETEDYVIETIDAVRSALMRLDSAQVEAERHDLAALLSHAIGAVKREREFAAVR